MRPSALPVADPAGRRADTPCFLFHCSALQGDLEAKKAECVARTAAEAVLREQIAKLRTSVEELKTERDGDLMCVPCVVPPSRLC